MPLGRAAGQIPDSTAADSLPTARLPVYTVSAARTPRPLEDVPGATSAIPGTAITRGRAGDGLGEVLGRVPGVVVQQRYNHALDQQVSIRGFGSRSAFGIRGIVVLLDGIPQTLPDGQTQLTTVELADVDALEVWRGAASVLYGNAAGGVIAMRTASHAPVQPDATARLSVGAFGFRKTHVSAASPLGSGGIRVGASLTRTDGFRDHGAAELRRAALRAVQSLGRTTVVVHAHGAHMPWAENPGALTRAEADGDPAGAAPAYVAADAGKEAKQAQVGSALRHTLRRGGSLEVAVFGLRRELDNALPFGRIAFNRWTYGARLQATLPLGGGPVDPQITVGADVTAQRDDRTNRTLDGQTLTLDQLERVRQFGPFVQGRLQVGPTVLTAGVRYDGIAFRVTDRLGLDGDQSGTRVMGRPSFAIGTAVAVTGHVRLHAHVGTTFQTPTTTELVNRPDGSGGLNPELGPQRAVHYEIGARLRGPGRAAVTAAAFRADVRDGLIAFEVPTVPGRRFYRNAGRVRHEGIELDGSIAIRAGLRVRGAYTLARHRFVEFRTATDTLDGNRLPALPRHRVSAAVEAETSPGLWVEVEALASSAVPANDANTVEIGGWAAVDLRLGWSATVGRIVAEPYVTVLNVFDRRYIGSVVANAAGERYFEPSPGRTLLLGITVGR